MLIDKYMGYGEFSSIPKLTKMCYFHLKFYDIKFRIDIINDYVG